METEAVQSPWDQRNAMVNTVFFLMPFLTGSYAIAKYKPRKLPFFLGAYAAFLTLGRRRICARCQYCGQECALIFGILTAKIMSCDKTRHFSRKDLYINFALLAAIESIPQPQVFKSRKLALLFYAFVVTRLGAVLFNACAKCGNDFCPTKDLHKAILR
jgi:hypothetical protein